MRMIDGELLHSASNLITYLNCSRAAALQSRRRCFPAGVLALAADSAEDVTVAGAGLHPENDYLEMLRQGGEVAEISGADGSRRKGGATRR